MNSSFYSLYTLKSLSSDNIEHLHQLGITNLGDLLAYQPFRYARFIRAAADHLLRKDEIIPYLDQSARDREPHEILATTTNSLKGLGGKSANILQQLGIESISDLASYLPYTEAEEIVTRAVSDESDPFAPACVLPTCKKFTRNSKSFVSFFKQEEIRNLSVLSKKTSLISNLFSFGSRESKVIYLGYSVSYLQEWIYTGVHLGEPQGSVSLFMGQDTQVSVLDWRRAIISVRAEDTKVSEHLKSTLFHQRAVDEVARATAEEHQHGGTSAFGANAATAGSFVAAGALVGGVGGGVSGALTGLAVDALTGGTDLGLGTISGMAVGTAVGSVAGAAAGSLIFSGATTLGFVETDAEGDREIYAGSAQRIQQRTKQNSSSIRSFWSNIISQSVQDEQQRQRTDRVTNHNRIHALNALYFEVLNEYRVNISAYDFAPILFLPFKPIYFTQDILRRYWWLIRTLLDDRELVLALDQYFLTLSTDPSPAAELEELPDISEIETGEVVVEVNVDGSRMEDIIRGVFETAFGFLITGPIILLMEAFRVWFDNSKRENIKVSLITSTGSVNLIRQGSPNDNWNLVGRYTSPFPIRVHTIEKIRITNENPEFQLSIPGWTINVNRLAFEEISARVTIRNKSRFRKSLPNLGQLEDRQIIKSDTFILDANRSKEFRWDIAERLSNQFEGIESERKDLIGVLEDVELNAAKIDRLLGFLNANKFGFTRLILQNTEREQVMSVLEGVEIGGVDLTSIAGTTPLGFCGNHVVLPLKNCSNTNSNHDPIDIDTIDLEVVLAQFSDLNLRGDPDVIISYFTSLRAYLIQFIQLAKSSGGGSHREQQLLALVETLKTLLDRLFQSTGTGLAMVPSVSLQITNVQVLNRIQTAIANLLVFLNTPTKSNTTDVSRLCGYYEAVKSSLTPKMGQIIGSDEVSLPSPAVFMEPVLSNAKGAELYDMRRNSHYEILPAPGIGEADPNVIRYQDIQLTPNIPGANLTIQNAPQWALPTSITSALTEAGKLDLSTLISTNAGTLNSTLANLSTVASELAKASAQLTGDAQKQALNSATDVAKQIGDIINKSLQNPPTASPPPKPEPPKGPQQKAEVVRELDRINKGGGSNKEKKEKKETVGAPVASDDTLDYQMSIMFLDENGIPYPSGEFTLTMTFFELRSSFDINGGVSIPMATGQFFFPDTFSLIKGRKATIQISANISDVFIPGLKEFTLPDKPDIVFKCRMLSETRKISATDVKSAVDAVMHSSSFGTSLNPIFSSFLNAGVGFPFGISKISADGGVKQDLDLRVEYNKSSSTTSTTTTGTTTMTEYEVVIPKNGWAIEIV